MQSLLWQKSFPNSWRRKLLFAFSGRNEAFLRKETFVATNSLFGDFAPTAHRRIGITEAYTRAMSRLTKVIPQFVATKVTFRVFGQKRSFFAKSNFRCHGLSIWRFFTYSTSLDRNNNGICTCKVSFDESHSSILGDESYFSRFQAETKFFCEK